MASIFTGLHFFFPSAFWSWLAFAASLAAVNADKWATELGGLNPTFPRLITSWKPVERGTSWAVSIYGTLATAGGVASMNYADFRSPGEQGQAGLSR